jgi:hypothetical protein
MKFRELFSKHSITIPLFQRSYCWGDSTLVESFWRDVSKTTDQNCHRLGKIIVKKNVSDSMLCIDGQ